MWVGIDEVGRERLISPICILSQKVVNAIYAKSAMIIYTHRSPLLTSLTRRAKRTHGLITQWPRLLARSSHRSDIENRGKGTTKRPT